MTQPTTDPPARPEPPQLINQTVEQPPTSRSNDPMAGDATTAAVVMARFYRRHKSDGNIDYLTWTHAARTLGTLVLGAEAFERWSAWNVPNQLAIEAAQAGHTPPERAVVVASGRQVEGRPAGQPQTVGPVDVMAYPKPADEGGRDG